MAMQFRVFRAKKDGSGVASFFEVRKLKKQVSPDRVVDRYILVVNSSPQTPGTSVDNATFLWKEKDKSTFVQLNEFEAAAILLVLRGVNDGVGPKKEGEGHRGLFHQTPNGNATIKFEYNGNSYTLSVSTKRDDNLVRLSHTISMEEGIVLQELLSDFISAKYGWRNVE